MTKKRINPAYMFCDAINWDAVDQNLEALEHIFCKEEAQKLSMEKEQDYDWLPKVDEEKLKASIDKIMQK